MPEPNELTSFLVMFLVALITGYAYLAFGVLRPHSSPRTLFKTAPVTLLAIAAMLGNLPGLLVAALVFGALGDFFLARNGDVRFLAGLSSFLVAHICFAALFFQLGTGFGIVQVIILLLLFWITVWFLRYLWPYLGTMRIPVFMYAIAIAIMAFASSLVPANLLLHHGVVFFLISDMVLAHRLFAMQAGERGVPLAERAIWFLYFSGQALILAGLFFLRS